ncbi:MAG: hypothetical protein A3K08_00715, partial [Candidatus Doudnabacteria bacterium RIFCSPLOWO2_01_41_7]
AGCTSGNEPLQPTTPIVAEDCTWRVPTGQFPFGTCEAVVGAYFDGTSCVSLSGCPNEAAGKVPFSSLENCMKVCQPKQGIVPSSEVKEFKIEAKQFEFVPSTITVNEGDTVRLIVTSKDTEHGIGIPEFDVSLKVDAGKTETGEFVADKKGTYSMNCNVFCGSGHRNMKGTLIVK